ncbi:MAG: SDR family oxidoreductase [Armatimonadetes bacterium]|nr:SDR family oxidoreductase [Armatimonadota bacterium]
MGLLDGKVVLVTGGSRNVGAGIAITLAEHGASIALSYLEEAQRADDVAGKIAALGVESTVWQCDVSDYEAVKAMIDGMVERHGRIDAIVNNANGALGTDESGWFISESNWDFVMARIEMGAHSLLNTTRAALPYFRRQGGGRVVSISSDQYIEAYSAPLANTAGKSAMVGVSRRLAFDHGRENITFNIVSPGWTRTERTNGRDTQDHFYVREAPLRKIAEPEDIGYACVYFISELGRCVTGAHILVNGGRHPQMGF